MTRIFTNALLIFGGIMQCSLLARASGNFSFDTSLAPLNGTNALELCSSTTCMRRLFPTPNLCSKAIAAFNEMAIANESWSRHSRLVFPIVTKPPLERFPDSSDFRSWNLRNRREPCIYLQPADLKSVQTAQWVAYVNEIPIRIYGGGHDYNGYSAWSGPVINMQRLKHIDILDDVEFDEWHGPAMKLQAGVRWKEAYNKLDNGEEKYRKYYISGGLCPPVGNVGFTLGGGINHGYCRHYGLAIDNLLEAEVVSYDGQVLIANARENPLLFWALRGGRGGSFGIVTSLTFKLHDSGGSVGSGLQYYFYYHGNSSIFGAMQRMRHYGNTVAMHESRLGLDSHVNTKYNESSGQDETYAMVRLQWNVQSDTKDFANYLNMWVSFNLSSLPGSTEEDYNSEQGFCPNRNQEANVHPVGSCTFEEWKILEPCMSVTQDFTPDDKCLQHGDAPVEISRVEISCNRTAGEEHDPYHIAPLEYAYEVQDNFFVHAVPDKLIQEARQVQLAASALSAAEFVFSMEFMYNCTKATPTKDVSYPHGDVWFFYWECYARDELTMMICSGLSTFLSYKLRDTAVMTGMYSNYNNAKYSHFNELFYGSSLPLLKKVKETYDPQDIFCFEQSIPLPGHNYSSCIEQCSDSGQPCYSTGPARAHALSEVAVPAY